VCFLSLGDPDAQQFSLPSMLMPNEEESIEVTALRAIDID
jgi:hypothetical protein